MTDVKHHQIETNGISMHVAEAGAGRPVLFCHGFPELWYSWRHQLNALSAAGFRAIAPDQRGFGDTDAPQAIESYSIHHLVGDLTGMLDALGIETTVVVVAVETVVVVVGGWGTEVLVEPVESPGLHAATSSRVATRGLLMPSS